MDKIKLSDVYIAVEGEAEFGVYKFADDGKTLICQCNAEKKTDMVVMSKEDFEKAIGDAFDAGLKKGFADGADISDFTDHPDLEQYLNNLKP